MGHSRRLSWAVANNGAGDSWCVCRKWRRCGLVAAWVATSWTCPQNGQRDPWSGSPARASGDSALAVAASSFRPAPAVAASSADHRGGLAGHRRGAGGGVVLVFARWTAWPGPRHHRGRCWCGRMGSRVAGTGCWRRCGAGRTRRLLCHHGAAVGAAAGPAGAPPPAAAAGRAGGWILQGLLIQYELAPLVQRPRIRGGAPDRLVRLGTAFRADGSMVVSWSGSCATAWCRRSRWRQTGEVGSHRAGRPGRRRPPVPGGGGARYPGRGRVQGGHHAARLSPVRAQPGLPNHLSAWSAQPIWTSAGPVGGRSARPCRTSSAWSWRSRRAVQPGRLGRLHPAADQGQGPP